MKIFYAVQATGNGHISRAIEILPYLRKYGEVDIFLSGSNAQLGSSLPILYRSKGLSLLYDNKGGLDYWKIFKSLRPLRMIREAWKLPLDKYDLVLNDFESITSLACKIKGIKSVHFGHQASFRSNAVPRPEHKDWLGEWVLRNYCVGSLNLGLHFKAYDSNINTPIIKERIRNAQPTNRGHVTVYLPQFPNKEIITYFRSLSYIQFEVFSRENQTIQRIDNITFYPVDNEIFTESMIHCTGVITGGGFETPAEAMYLGKKLMVFPIRGQYEQWCNAAALGEWKIPILDSLNTRTGVSIHRWYYHDNNDYPTEFPDNKSIISWLFNKVEAIQKSGWQMNAVSPHPGI